MKRKIFDTFGNGLYVFAVDLRKGEIFEHSGIDYMLLKALPESLLAKRVANGNEETIRINNYGLVRLVK